MTQTLAGVRRVSHEQRRQNILGYLYISPWILGFLLFTFGPMVASLGLSLFNYRVIAPAKWLALRNYTYALQEDPLFWLALGKTFYYSLVFVPLSMLGSLVLAMLLNQRVRGESVFRTFFYLPTLTPAPAAAVLWVWLLNSKVGLVNYVLSLFGIQGPAWLGSSAWAMPAIVLITLWTSVGGGRMIIFLAGLQGVPEDLYEAADIDGAGTVAKFLHITLPSISPTILFNMVLGVIGALQVFTTAYITTSGGPGRATWFYALHIYTTAFQQFDMGYASALSWLLFVILLVFTLVQLRMSDAWVYYAG